MIIFQAFPRSKIARGYREWGYFGRIIRFPDVYFGFPLVEWLENEVIMPFLKRPAFPQTALLSLGLLAGSSFSAPALPAVDDQSLVVPIQSIRAEKIASAKIGETREIWISLPDGYVESGEKYPVLYMMDADFNFNSGVIGGLRYAAFLGEMPEFIIVGIKNTDRSKDIFPEEVIYQDGSKGGGRADQYLDFISEELIPHIDKTFRTENFRVLYGTSNTGFTAVYAMFRDPDLANACIAASATLSIPSFKAKRDEWIRGFKGGKRRLVLVMGEKDLPTVLSQNGALKEALDTLAPPDLTGRFLVIGNGGHVPADSLRLGLSALFEGWKIVQPLREDNFAEIRKQADQRIEKYGVSGKLPEDSLRELGAALLGEKKSAEALDVLRYRADLYPRSADARVALGDAYRQSGQTAKARECYNQARVLVPGHREASFKLKELDSK
jgi:predicted alpha/beta superfamily hydrolase